MCSERQTARANQWLFKDRITYPTTWDLHILLADYNDRGERGPLVQRTHELAKVFKAALSTHSEHTLLGRIWCLKKTSTFRGALDVAWVV